MLVIEGFFPYVFIREVQFEKSVIVSHSASTFLSLLNYFIMLISSWNLRALLPYLILPWIQIHPSLILRDYWTITILVKYANSKLVHIIWSLSRSVLLILGIVIKFLVLSSVSNSHRHRILLPINCILFQVSCINSLMRSTWPWSRFTAGFGYTSIQLIWLCHYFLGRHLTCYLVSLIGI